MKNVLECHIIEAKNIAELNDLIAEWIKHGWQPSSLGAFPLNSIHNTVNITMFKYGTVKHKMIRKTETTE